MLAGEPSGACKRGIDTPVSRRACGGWPVSTRLPRLGIRQGVGSVLCARCSVWSWKLFTRETGCTENPPMASEWLTRSVFEFGWEVATVHGGEPRRRSVTPMRSMRTRAFRAACDENIGSGIVTTKLEWASVGSRVWVGCESLVHLLKSLVPFRCKRHQCGVCELGHLGLHIMKPLVAGLSPRSAPSFN